MLKTIRNQYFPLSETKQLTYYAKKLTGFPVNGTLGGTG